MKFPFNNLSYLVACRLELASSNSSGDGIGDLEKGICCCVGESNLRDDIFKSFEKFKIYD